MTLNKWARKNLADARRRHNKAVKAEKDARKVNVCADDGTIYEVYKAQENLENAFMFLSVVQRFGRKKAPREIELTNEEARAILECENGCDVYSYALAGTIRKMERRGVKGLFDITRAMHAPENGAERQPYFGCISTPEGVKQALETLKERGEPVRLT